MKFSKDEIYDKLVPAFCPPYKDALEHFAQNTSNVKSVTELGIGTGNIAKIILENSPLIEYVGIDFLEESLEKAKIKLSGYDVSLIQGDFSTVFIPKADIIVSSLSIHHLEHYKQAELFEKIHNSCNSFLHFELFAPTDDKEKIENTSYLKDHVAKVCKEMNLPNDEIYAMLEKSNASDRPMALEEHVRLHEKFGSSTKILFKDHDFGMYQTFKK